MSVGSNRNISLDGDASGPSRNPATEHVMHYFTWRPSALITRPQGQVIMVGEINTQIRKQNLPHVHRTCNSNR